MKHNELFRQLNLQLFADGGGAGGDGGTGSVGATGDTAAAAVPQNPQKVRTKNPLADVKYGIQKEQNAPPAEEHSPQEQQKPDRNAEFEKLIKGDYKDQYDQKVQDTVKRRLKSTQDTLERYQKLTPTLEMLGRKYGISPDQNGHYDAEALHKAIQEDNSFYEKEAQERGLSVEQFKQMRKMELENAELQRRVQQQNSREKANQLYRQWSQEANALQSVYPAFDLKAELQNPKFGELLSAGIDVRTAYEVLHKDEIIPAAMQFTANEMERKLVNKVMANAQRPAENGAGGQGAAIVKSDVSQLTKEDRQEIIRRVQRGEKISF